MERIKALIEGKEKIVIVVAILLVVVLLAWVALKDISKEKELEYLVSTEANIEFYQTELQKYFSLLEEREIGYDERVKGKEISLFLKKPFISSSEVQQLISWYINILKYQYNHDETHFLGGAIFHIYNREGDFEEGLNPFTTFTYMLAQENEEKREKADEYLLHTDLRWEHSLEQEKLPNYDSAYTLSGSYQPPIDSNGEALSDVEYQLLKKLSLYAELAGTDLKGALRYYLMWEMGILIREDAIIERKSYLAFLERARSVGENQLTYAGKREELMIQLAVENPRFLAFMLMERIYDEKLDAKKALVQFNQEFFLPVYIEEATALLDEGGNPEEALSELDEIENGDVVEGEDVSEYLNEID